jgi:hypothetical protein
VALMLMNGLPHPRPTPPGAAPGLSSAAPGLSGRRGSLPAPPLNNESSSSILQSEELQSAAAGLLGSLAPPGEQQGQGEQRDLESEGGAASLPPPADYQNSGEPEDRDITDGPPPPHYDLPPLPSASEQASYAAQRAAFLALNNSAGGKCVSFEEEVVGRVKIRQEILTGLTSILQFKN